MSKSTEGSKKKPAKKTSQSKAPSQSKTPSFDRIKPPKSTRSPAEQVGTRENDLQGKRALFSGADQPPNMGSVSLTCSACEARSVVSYVRLAKMWVSGFYVPVPGVSQRAWIKCPACEQHAWLTISRS
ncbi:MAG: hypothetical protein WAS05_03305 [Candidatus Nanopelagicales bacterium]